MLLLLLLWNWKEKHSLTGGDFDSLLGESRGMPVHCRLDHRLRRDLQLARVPSAGFQFQHEKGRRAHMACHLLEGRGGQLAGVYGLFLGLHG